MITAFDIYLIGLMDGLQFVLLIVGIFVVLLSFFGHGEEKVPMAGIVCGILFVLVAAFIPSSKTLATMYVLPQIANNERIQGLTGDGLTIVELKMAEWIKALKEEKVE